MSPVPPSFLLSQPVDICSLQTQIPLKLRHTSHQENTGLLIGFLLVKEMWLMWMWIRFFGGEFDVHVIQY